jgi:hypothetical protein
MFITLEAGKKYKITSTSSITTSTVSFYLFDVTGEKEKLLSDKQIQFKEFCVSSNKFHKNLPRDKSA